MSNSPRPHRRLSLTLPSTSPVDSTISEPVEETLSTTETTDSPKPIQSTPKQRTPKPLKKTSEPIEAPITEAETVRVMAYLTTEESQILDELWLLMRRKHGKVSKSDILRASLMMANSNQELLNSTMSKQQINTSSRHRISKLVKQ